MYEGMINLSLIRRGGLRVMVQYIVLTGSKSLTGRMDGWSEVERAGLRDYPDETSDERSMSSASLCGCH